MADQPPVPPIPERTRRPRRRSLPTSSDTRSKKRSPNQIRTQTASPEVISSLIDSLSAISAPAYDHFEQLPKVGESNSTPVSPGLAHNSFHGNGSSTSGGSFGVEYGVHRRQMMDDSLYPDDAAEPPVIKTAPPPSGLSPITAPKRKDRSCDSSLKNYLRSGSLRSVTSLNSTKDRDDASSIGNVSIDNGLRRTASRESIRSERSSTGARILKHMSSREHLRSKEPEQARRTINLPPLRTKNSGSDLLSARTTTFQPPSPRSPRRQFFVDNAIDEEPSTLDSSPENHSRKNNSRTSSKSPVRLGKSPVDRNGGNSPVVGRAVVPQRASSLKQRDSSSRSRGRRRRHGSHDSTRTATVPEEEEEKREPQKDLPHEEKKDTESDTEVTRRIKQLKAQKEARQKQWGLAPITSPTTEETDAVSDISGGPLSPISATSSTPSFTEERSRKTIEKAHKLLGITSPAPTLPSPTNKVSPTPNLPDSGDISQNLHPLPRKEDENRNESADDVTTLPIDYRLALQSLDHITPPESNSDKSSQRTSTTGIQKRKSVAVGGRSAVSRQATASLILEKPPTVRKDLPPVTLPPRSVSAELTQREHSLNPLTIAKSAEPTAVQAAPKQKKRWSHPDIPLKAEQRHNRLADAQNAKSPPPQAVIVERPASVDSIDIDVDRFLNASRLSQKVRHPQTGRIISFSEVGDPNGYAVFCCVGMGLTRYITAFYDELAISLKLRLITPDRPGVGESQAHAAGTPLAWPDDVAAICAALKISKFSIMAHSAGAIYALATALRMPQHIRGRVHLLAPWIPPSQMSSIGLAPDLPPGGQLPRGQRFLRVLPTPFLKVANSTFMSATSASITRSVPKSPQRNKRRSVGRDAPTPRPGNLANNRRDSIMLMDQMMPNTSKISIAARDPNDPNHEAAKQAKAAQTAAEKERQRYLDARLTLSIWDHATSNANPAVDLLVCLERTQPIGFRYVDITRAVVIHHGSRDTRVPVENVKWLGRTMKRCEVRILEGEGHGLMASAMVMGNVLTEMAKEWEDWTAIIKGGLEKDKESSRRRKTDML
ncbi:alpha/beta-hydrolase [Patellaria atrata CBS 101060]|uniref:Alpha/beta-hydrolase n=1 Tax=Patellaria atrata CBS 101060 TaxID=1346257 RepID=A0A9P4VPL6_9PEZI|nr:alpha/beta-hydrolase [Patellaria atrata CBS 101060]